MSMVCDWGIFLENLCERMVIIWVFIWLFTFLDMFTENERCGKICGSSSCVPDLGIVT